MKTISFVTLILLGLTSCQTYKYAAKVKFIAFHDNIEKGEASGNVSSKDCQSFVLGYPTGPDPTLDHAFELIQAKGGEGKNLRYLNDVSTETEGFNALVYAKRCLIVKGRGYR